MCCLAAAATECIALQAEFQQLHGAVEDAKKHIRHLEEQVHNLAVEKSVAVAATQRIEVMFKAFALTVLVHGLLP